MKTKLYLETFIFIIVFSFSGLSYAKESPEDIISKYLELTNKNPDEAISYLLKGSVIENDPTAISQSNLVRQMNSLIGNYQDHSVLKKFKLSDKNMILLVVAHHEKGTTYSQFNFFQSANNKWVIQLFSFNSSPSYFGTLFFDYAEQE